MDRLEADIDCRDRNKDIPPHRYQSDNVGDSSVGRQNRGSAITVAKRGVGVTAKPIAKNLVEIKVK